MFLNLKYLFQTVYLDRYEISVLSTSIYFEFIIFNPLYTNLPQASIPQLHMTFAMVGISAKVMPGSQGQCQSDYKKARDPVSPYALNYNS